MTRRNPANPSQESLSLDAHPEELQPVPYLNSNEGVILLNDLPGFLYDPERPLSYLEFAKQIGVALAEQPRQSRTLDRALDVHEADFKKASISALDEGLYFGRDAARSRSEVVTISSGQPTLRAPGVRDRYEGVAVTGKEFKLIARSPSDLAKHAHATVTGANEKRDEEERLDDETLANRAGRATAHAMLQRRDSLLDYDEELRSSRAALWMVNQLIRLDRGEQKPMAELDRYRLEAEIAIHGAIKVVCRQLAHGTTIRQAIDRAVVSDLFRADDESIFAATRSYTKWAGYYIDAKRGKLYQSLSRCKVEFNKNKHYLKTKELETDD